MMSKKMPLRLSLLLILALSVGRGEVLGWVGRDDEKPFRLYTKALDAPIGLIKGDLVGSDSLSINGRKSPGEQFVWNGDLLHSSTARMSEVALTSVGRLQMSRNTTVRIAASLPAESGGRRRLVATLISGEIAVQLEPGSDAYVEARGDVFRSSAGAEFRVQAQEGQPAAVATRGEVTA